ncbi:hypothetical protein JCM19232_4964 [Vibrio ishigakensis]|uniref:Helicase HerA central domain-containing protein n=1 Tax=Vibrio ishigakensis TaxID=1481914 RepID=A0A0B8PS62_9VIBR|nr:hypothetical protein JCM19232_4964 [Vibrio ishigakensis]
MRRLVIFFTLLGLGLGTLANFSVPLLIHALQTAYTVPPSKLSYPFISYFYIPIFILGITIHITVRRTLAPVLNQTKEKLTKKTKMARDERTDVRTVKDFLPESFPYDPMDYIDLSKGVFVGLDREHKPQYIPLEDIQKQHCGINGTTGAGKGVATGLILHQLIQAGEGTFVLDPKNDEWAPHLMKHACEQAGKPFYLIDLNKKAEQLDLLADAR